MFFSKTAIHGIYAICFLNRQEDGIRCSSSTVATALGIGKEHASKLLKQLAAEGVIASTRGRNGGYALTKTLAEIPVISVLDALNPPPKPSRMDATSCNGLGAHLCSAHQGLIRLDEQIRHALGQETLAGLAGSMCIFETPFEQDSESSIAKHVTVSVAAT